MARVKFTFESREVKRNLELLPIKIERVITGANLYWANYSVGYMKTTARWTDRTGAARVSLHALANHTPGSNTWEIVLAHGVRYGFWLEVAHGRKYEILQTSQRVIGHMYLRSLEGLLGRIK